MLKVFYFLFVLSFLPLQSQSSLSGVRDSFYTINSEAELELFIKKANDCTNIKCEIYKAAAIIRKAEFAFFPTKKLSFFKEGKKLLESFVTQYPNDVEARYIRSLIKYKTPRFLDYHKDFKADVNFVLKHLNTSKISPPSYKTTMLNYYKKLNLL